MKETRKNIILDPENYLDDYYAVDFNDENNEEVAKKEIQDIINEVENFKYPITVYRGINTINPDENYDGSSWSRNKEVAESFGNEIFVGMIPDSGIVDIEQTIRTRVMNPYEDEIYVPDSKGVKIIKKYNKNLKEIRKIIREAINSSIQEDYPEMFKMEEFKTLTSFKERIRYCESFLKRISSGSSRIVYKIDDGKVLKLAGNKKGIAQNETEVDFSKETNINYLFAKVYDYDPGFLWVEMQFAKKLTESKFAQINMFSFKDFAAVLKEKYYDVVEFRKGPRPANIHPDIKERIWESEFYKDVTDYMVNFDTPVGDLIKTSSYGIVGEDEIVLVDFGFTKDVAKDHYGYMAEGENAEDCTNFFDLNSLDKYVEFDKPLYSIVAKRRTGKLIYLSPKQYIYRIAHGFGGLSYEDAMRAVNTELVDKYAEDMKNGDKFPVGYFTEDNANQEGRHRALAAMKLGCQKIPVIQFTNLDNNQFKKVINHFKDMDFDELNELFINMGFENGISQLGWGDLQRYITYNLK